MELLGHGVRSILINTAKLLSRKDEVAGSCRQGGNACLHTFQCTAGMGYGQSSRPPQTFVRQTRASNCWDVLVLMLPPHPVCLPTVGTCFCRWGGRNRSPKEGARGWGVWRIKNTLSELSVLNLSGFGSQGLGSGPQSPPKVRTPWVLPGGTTARLRLSGAAPRTPRRCPRAP